MKAKKTAGQGTPTSQDEVYAIDADEPVYTSGVVCRILDIPVWVLKQLDREKVVSPPRREGKFRLYSNRDLKTLEHVWYLMKRRHVNVDGVKVIMELEMTYVSRSEGGVHTSVRTISYSQRKAP